MKFADALKVKEDLEAEADAASKALQKFPSGPMGLTPDAVKATPKFQKARQRYALADKMLRDYNTVFLRAYKKEYKAYVAEKRASKMKAANKE